MSTPSLFDAEVLRDIAMSSVQHNTDSNWIRAAETSVQWLARSSALGFTTDDVWEHLDKLGMTGQVHDNRATWLAVCVMLALAQAPSACVPHLLSVVTRCLCCHVQVSCSLIVMHLQVRVVEQT